MRSDLTRNKHWLRDLLTACWNVLNFCRRVFLNIGFIFILVVMIIAVNSSQPAPNVIKNNSVLTLNLVGDVVEQKTYVDPYDELLSDMTGDRSRQPEVLLTDILDVVNTAAADENIKGLVLNLHSIKETGLNKLQEIANAITQFKASGKPVIAYGDYYSQSQYYIAAHADETYLHPMGAIGLDGFGRYRSYFKSALEKLKVNAHVFRVGTFKSAVEPFLRDDMSSAAKEANQQWLGDLWSIYKADVANARQFETSVFDEDVENFLAKLKDNNGSFAQYSLANNWVDDLKTHQQLDEHLNQTFGKKAHYVNFNQYLDAISQEFYQPSEDRVAIVVAKGTIYDGKRKPGEIGGQSTAALLKQARTDKSVKAVVIRVDSPGGSAFASELIRNEVDAIKAAGKPVVVSMSTMAASGGYWISSSADQIWAAPTTITGSIGIFGMFLTFEDSLKSLGLHTDGIATTEMNGLSPFRTLDPKMGDVIQLAIEHGYDQFISLVAKHRKMTKPQVDGIAQGRVWSGKKAKQLGLVDHLGFFDDAINAAAELAGLNEYDTKLIHTPLDPMEQFIQDLFKTYIKTDENEFDIRARSVQSLVNMVANEATKWSQMNDPAGVYIYCLECDSIN